MPLQKFGTKIRTWRYSHLIGMETQTLPAHIILRQLAGSMGRLVAMTGAKHVMHDNDGYTLRMQLPNAHDPEFGKVTHVVIHLNGKDLYDMEFWRCTSGGVRKGKWVDPTQKVLRKVEDVYNDMLRPIFEKYTQLYLSL